MEPEKIWKLNYLYRRFQIYKSIKDNKVRSCHQKMMNSNTFKYIWKEIVEKIAKRSKNIKWCIKLQLLFIKRKVHMEDGYKCEYKVLKGKIYILRHNRIPPFHPNRRCQIIPKE